MAEQSAGADRLRVEMAAFPEMNPGPVVRTTRDGTILLVNTAARTLFPDEELSGRDWRDVCPGIEPAVWQRVIAGEDRVQHEAEIGDRVFTFTYRRPTDVDSVFIYGNEITERKRAERLLAEQSARIAEMARFPEMNPGPVVRTTYEGIILLVNTAAQALFEDEKLAGRDWREVCPGIEPAVWERMIAGEDRLQHEAEIGDRVLTFTYRRPAEVDSVFIYGNDITERKRAERLLAAQSAQIAEMARFPEMNPGPVLRTDPLGIIVLANAAAREVFGADTLIGSRWTDLCPGMDDTIWTRVLSTTEVVPFETRMGDRFFSFAHRRTPEGHLVFIYGADVTPLRNAEETLRQTERMAMLGTLAAGVAHELNNPAAAAWRSAAQLREAFGSLQDALIPLTRIDLSGDRVNTFLGLLAQDHREREVSAARLPPLERADLEQRVEEWLDDRGAAKAWELAPALVSLGYSDADLAQLGAVWHEDAPAVVAWIAGAQLTLTLTREIEDATRRISDIVGALKTYAFLDQSPLLEVDVREGIESTLVMLNSKLKDGITVLREYDQELPGIEAYGGELNQVWTNVLDNAVDAMGGSGRIVVRARRGDNGVIVEIEDDGPGIPASAQERIFDPFFTTKEPGKGAGLGLSTAQNIVVKKHGGTISVSSRPGRTCFSIGLPGRLNAGARESAEATAVST